MSEFIKSGDRVVPMPQGLMYDLEPGRVYDLKIYTSWGEVVEALTLNGELNTPKKVYVTNKDEQFVKRVLNDFNNTAKNTTGVLLVGEKGTGKTVTAKLLAERGDLPIIVMNPKTELDKITGFFKKFTTPVCILFDEVDKEFDTSELLTFLDGLQKTSKKLVIMTANDEDVIDNYLKNRCSRIRYYRQYNIKDDAEEYAKLICEDKGLDNADEVVKFILDKISCPSIDNILSFVDEILLTKEYNLTLDEVLEFMNINIVENDESECNQ